MIDPKTGKACGLKLKEDCTRSTKLMSNHSKSRHQIFKDGPAAKKQLSVIGHFKQSTIGGTVVFFILYHHFDVFSHYLIFFLSFFTLYLQKTLTLETFKTSLCYLIANCNLPYAIVNQKLFKDHILLGNSQTGGILVQQHSTAQHCSKVYQHYKKNHQVGLC